MTSNSNDRWVVVLTENKEIFCGKCKDYEAVPLELSGVRQAVYFSADTHGLLGLATDGPAKGSRIGPKVERMLIYRPVNIILCAPEAVETWAAAGWEQAN